MEASAPVEISDPHRLVRAPEVSVLMLAYNHAPYIEQAVRSVLAQQGIEFELIVGEDASTDDTRSRLLALQRENPERVRVLAWKENAGMHRNFAAVQNAARSELIAFCEGDDYWLHEDKLRIQFAYMQRHPECGLVHGNFLHLVHLFGKWRTHVAFSSRAQLAHREGALYQAMLQANRIQTCTVLCRRQLLTAYRMSGPGVDAYSVGDWPLFLSISRAANIGFIREPLAAYRRTPGSAMNSGPAADIRHALSAIRMNEDFCDHFNDDELTRKSALGVQYRSLLRFAFRAKDVQRFNQAWEWLWINHRALLARLRPCVMRVLMYMPHTIGPALRLRSMVATVVCWFEFRAVESAKGERW